MYNKMFLSIMQNNLLYNNRDLLAKKEVEKGCIGVAIKALSVLTSWPLIFMYN